MNRQLILMRSVGSAVLLCLGPALPAYGVTLFSEDYEVNAVSDLTSNGWEVINNVDRDGSPTMAIVTAPAGRTGKVLRLQYQGIHDNDNRNAKITRYFTGVPEVYERYYVRYDPITAGASGFTPITAKQHFFNAGASAPAAISNYMWGEPRFIFGVNHTTAVTCPNGGTDITCNYYQNAASITMTPGVYWCVETHLKMNTPSASDGIVEVWINGIQTVNYPNVKFRDPATPSATFHSVQVYRQGSDNMYRYEDDYVLATTRVGCGGAPPPPPVDAQAPSAPADLSAQAASSSQVNLTWSASSDNVGVTGYRIYRGGLQIAATAGTSYSDTGLAASTAYTYTVAAYDAAGNVSAQSTAASATTPAGAPSGPSGLLVDFGASAGANAFGLAGWNTVIKDVYTTYSSAGPGGTMSGFNGGYDYQGVTGTVRTFAAGDEIVVTWYNSGSGAATFTPQISMSVPGRVGSGAGWYPMSPVTIPSAGTAASRFAFSAATSGAYSLVNVNVNLDNSALVCDKIALVNAAAGATCDANNDGATNVVDVQLGVNQALGAAACASDINQDGTCNVVDVQRIVNAAVGGACVMGF